MAEGGTWGGEKGQKAERTSDPPAYCGPRKAFQKGNVRRKKVSSERPSAGGSVGDARESFPGKRARVKKKDE